ncbi:MAG: hypothetical protein MUF84_14175 [Anaerolineae bacterium]|nr:hypothetical protein [Anaerolineae bacterium]
MRRGSRFVTATLFVVVTAIWLRASGAAPASAATAATASALNAGCYLATPTVCKLQVDPFAVQTFFGARLEGIRLQANGQTIYDFRTDVSNPPSGSYSPSRVKLGFAATCGRAYVVSLQVDDSSQPDFTTVAQTTLFTCPQGRSDVFLPLVTR